MISVLKHPLEPAIVFLMFFGFHLFAAGGTLVPYRDTGEMVVDAYTLGVAHPPGYPVYTLAGKVFCQAPWGNPTYRLNLLSAAASAAMEALVFVLFRGMGGALAGLAVGLLWATSPVAGELAAVSEMYSMALLGLMAVFFLAWRIIQEEETFSRWTLLAFIVGASCGVRTDFALMGPALLFLFWRHGHLRWALPVSVFFLLGLSVFLYLPLRSAQQPLIDWNNPEELNRLAGSLLRRTHGGTLDLLSKSYRPGENFMSEMGLFLKNSASAFSWASLPLAALGVWSLRRRSKDTLVFLALAFAVSGPLFIYLANMPPNPHAVAIVEAHYAAPQAALLLLVGWGAVAALGRAPVLGTAVIVVLVASNLAHSGRILKRWNFTARDYVTNMARSAAEGSVGVLREDVPLFAFWERTLVTGSRPDLDIVAQGLAASSWYHDMMRRQGRTVSLGPLKTQSDWSAFADHHSARPTWAGGDVNLAYSGETKSVGLPIYLNDAPRVPPGGLFSFYTLRGLADQARCPDFFSSDLVAEYARAALREAAVRVRARDWDGATHWLLQARRFDSESPSAPFHLGFVSFQRGDLDGAEKFYSSATRLHGKILQRAADYKSLPDVVADLRREAGEVWIHRGVVAERRNRLEDARNAYAEAIRLDPRSAQAHYNLAVTYWNRDWNQVIELMRRALALDPSHPDARAFLAKAESARGKT